MNYENIALLYLLNQDTKDLSLEELCELYENTIERVKQTTKEYHSKNNSPTFSFD